MMLSSRHRTCITAVCGLLLLGLAAASAGGCRGRAPERPTTQRPTPAWRVDVLKRTLPAVVLVRGRQLAVERLDSATATPIWTAPAETTPTILAVDQPGGRIAVLLRAAPDSSWQGLSRRYSPPQWQDAGIVVLSADGSAKRLRIVVVGRRIQGTNYLGDDSMVRRGGGIRLGKPSVAPTGTSLQSVDETITDLVTSAAFMGPDLVVTTRNAGEWRMSFPSYLAYRLSPDGTMTPASVESTKTYGFSLVQLTGGGTVIAGSTAAGSFLAPATLRGNSLELPPLAGRYSHEPSFMQDIASAYGTSSVAFVWETSPKRDIFVVDFANGTWTRSYLPGAVYRPKPGAMFAGGLLEKEIISQPQAGPSGQLLVAMERRLKMPYDSYSVAPTARLALVGPTDAQHPALTRVSVEFADDARFLVRTWTYLTRFGSAR